MPEFTYKAITASGRTRTGTIEATDKSNAITLLRKKTKQILSISEHKARKLKPGADRKKGGKDPKPKPKEPKVTKEKSAKSIKRFRGKELLCLNFLKRLLELHSSGLALGDAIRLLSQRLSEPQLKQVCAHIWKEISEGRNLASAMGTLPEVFPPSITFVIEAGEQTGELNPILEKIVTYMEERREIKSKVLASLAYPFFVIFVAVVVIVGVVTFMMPQIDQMLQQLGGERNFAAHILIESGEFLKVGGPFIFGGLLILGLGFVQWRRTNTGRKVTDKFLLGFPIVGPITLYSNLFQTCNLLGTLLASGLTTTEALRLTERTISNLDLRQRFNTTRTQVNEGVGFTTALRQNKFMPDLPLDILTVGENTGNLVHSLGEITKSFRTQLTQKMSSMTVMVSSGALGVAFSIVALVAYVMISSIFQVSSSIQ